MFRLLWKNFQVGRVTRPWPDQSKSEVRKEIGAPEIDRALCTGCGKCAAACPTSALRIRDNASGNERKLTFFAGACIFCGHCEPSCPYRAITAAEGGALSATEKDRLEKTFSFDLSKCGSDAAFIPENGLPMKKEPDFEARYLKGAFSKMLSLEESGARLRDRIGKLFGRSLHIREVDAGSCNGCEIEAVNLSNPVYDAERFGIHFVASPRHADMLLVTGPVSRQMELALVKTYNAAPSPRLVVACGSCAVSGGLFSESYAVTGGVDRVVPVDVYVPGCPPSPSEILQGILLALNQYKR